jgi:hypothetical protein
LLVSSARRVLVGRLLVKLFLEVAHLLWPSMVLAGLWLVVSLVAFWYAHSTRRPIFLFSGIGALLMMAGQVLSPVRLAYHYLLGISIPGGQAGRVELLVGAYKYQIAIEAMGALLFLAGLVREVMFARRRARTRAARAAEAAKAGVPPTGGAGPGNEALAAPASPGREPERAGFTAGQVGQEVAAETPLASYARMEERARFPLPVPEPEQSCPRCQAMLSVDAQFCGNCGMQLVPAEPPPDDPPTSSQGQASAHAARWRSREEFL